MFDRYLVKYGVVFLIMNVGLCFVTNLGAMFFGCCGNSRVFPSEAHEQAVFALEEARIRDNRYFFMKDADGAYKKISFDRLVSVFSNLRDNLADTPHEGEGRKINRNKFFFVFDDFDVVIEKHFDWIRCLCYTARSFGKLGCIFIIKKHKLECPIRLQQLRTTLGDSWIMCLPVSTDLSDPDVVAREHKRIIDRLRLDSHFLHFTLNGAGEVLIDAFP